MARYACVLIVACPDAASAQAVVDRLAGERRARMVSVAPREPELAHAVVEVRARSGAAAAAEAEAWLRGDADGLPEGATVVRRNAQRLRRVGLFAWRTGDRPGDSWDDGGDAAGDRARV